MYIYALGWGYVLAPPNSYFRVVICCPVLLCFLPPGEILKLGVGISLRVPKLRSGQKESVRTKGV